MNRIISVTLIPVSGINVKLDKGHFTGNFIDKSEEVLDDLPVGSAIEVIYDHVIPYSDGSFSKIKPMSCIIKQTSRGIFKKDITEAPLITDMKHINTRRAELKKLKYVYMNRVTK